MQKYDLSAKSYLSENLHLIISLWKMDQRQFAKLIGLKYATFNTYMNGGTFPRVPTLLVISDITGIPVDLFLRQHIPVGMIPNEPLKQGEKKQNMVEEPATVYGSNTPVLIDYSGLERRLIELEKEVSHLKKCQALPNR